jgi:TRAP transporter TAXI family solute receptor
MNPFVTRRALGLGALSGALAMPFVRTARAQQSFEWLAGSLGGGWYTMATGLASLVQEENADIRIRVTPGGGLANPTRVQQGQAQMAWGIDAFTAAAAKGEEPYNAKHDKLRHLGVGYSPTEHNFLRRADDPLQDMRAILSRKDIRVGSPQRSSTDDMTFQRILKFLGNSPEAIRSGGGRMVNGSYNDLVAAWNDGQVDYVYVALAKPAAMLNEIAQGRRAARLVEFPDDIRKHLSDTYAYGEGVLPAGTYPQLQDRDLKVTTMDTVLIAQESLPEEAIYKITRTLIRNRGQRMSSIHASMAAFDPAQAWRYPGVPIHPGAARAFREAGAMPA